MRKKSTQPITLFLLFILFLAIIINSCLSCPNKIVGAHSYDSRFPAGDADEEENEQCKAWLVQSIPTDMPHLPRVPGVLSSGEMS